MISPFLSAYNKRVDIPAHPAEQLQVFLDGFPLPSQTTRADAVLTSSFPRIELLRPNKPSAPSEEAEGSCPPALMRLLALPLEASDAEWGGALDQFNALASQPTEGSDASAFSSRFGRERKRRLLIHLLQRARQQPSVACILALRILSREGEHDEELRADSTLVLAAQLAGLARDGSEWDQETAEGCVLLVNLLVLGGERSASLLRDQLGAEGRVIEALSHPSSHSLPQLRLYAQALSTDI